MTENRTEQLEKELTKIIPLNERALMRAELVGRKDAAEEMINIITNWRNWRNLCLNDKFTLDWVLTNLQDEINKIGGFK